MDNLKAEMQRNGLTVRDIMRTIGCSEKTARNKINGETDFTYPEAEEVRNRLFPGMRMEYLFHQPCTPVEEAGGDYNELGLYLHSKENNRTLEAAQTLWEFLPGWMAARKMAVYDPDYNRSLSGVIAENAEIILKAAQDMAGWGLAECEPARKEETPQG